MKIIQIIFNHHHKKVWTQFYIFVCSLLIISRIKYFSENNLWTQFIKLTKP